MFMLIFLVCWSVLIRFVGVGLDWVVRAFSSAVNSKGCHCEWAQKSWAAGTRGNLWRWGAGRFTTQMGLVLQAPNNYHTKGKSVVL
jgi:hypothetical protein